MTFRPIPNNHNIHDYNQIKITPNENLSYNEVNSKVDSSRDTIRELADIRECYMTNINRLLEMKTLTKARMRNNQQNSYIDYFKAKAFDYSNDKDNTYDIDYLMKNSKFYSNDCNDNISHKSKENDLIYYNDNINKAKLSNKIEDIRSKDDKDSIDYTDLMRKSIILKKNKHHSDYEVKNIYNIYSNKYKNQIMSLNNIESSSILPIDDSTFTFKTNKTNKNNKNNIYVYNINDFYIKINEIFKKYITIYFIIFKKSILDKGNKNNTDNSIHEMMNNNNKIIYNTSNIVIHNQSNKSIQSFQSIQSNKSSISIQSSLSKDIISKEDESRQILIKLKSFFIKTKKIIMKNNKNRQLFKIIKDFILKKSMNKLIDNKIYKIKVRRYSSILKAKKFKIIEEVFDFFKENTNIAKVNSYFKYKLKQKSIKCLFLNKKTTDNLNKQAKCLMRYFAYKDLFNKIRTMNIINKNKRYNTIIINEFLRNIYKKKGFYMIKTVYISGSSLRKKKLDYYSSYMRRYDDKGRDDKKYINVQVKRSEMVYKGSTSKDYNLNRNSQGMYNRNSKDYGIRRVLKEEICLIKNK